MFYMVNGALLQTMVIRQLSLWLRLGCLMCSVSLIRGLGKCGTSCHNSYAILSLDIVSATICVSLLHNTMYVAGYTGMAN